MAKDSGLQRGAPQEWQRQQRAPSPAATSGGTVGAVPTHFHAAGAIVSGELGDERLPERLQEHAPAIDGDDCNLALENGWWAAGTLTANAPASSSWVGQTIRFPENALGDFSVQTAYEVVGAYRIYRRTQNIFWGAWEQIGVGVADPARNPTRAAPVQPVKSIITTLQSGHGWTSTNGDAATDLNDTTDPGLGSQSIKYVSNSTNTSGTIVSPTATAFDATGKDPKFLIKVTGLTNLVDFRFYAGDSTLANAKNWNLGPIETAGSVNNYIKEGEWQWVTLPWDSGSNLGTPATSRSAITKHQFRVQATNGTQTTVQVAAVAWVPQASSSLFPNGVVSFTYDDALASGISYGRLGLDKYGWGGTAFIIRDNVGTGATYATIAELKAARDRSGWEIACHSDTQANHNTGFTGITTAQVEAELQAERQWFYENGFGVPDGFAWPRGYSTAAVEEAAAKHVAYGRGNNTSLPRETFPPANPMRIRSQNVSSTNTLASMQTLIDQAKASRAWQLFTFHNIVASGATGTEVNQATHDGMVDYCSTQGVTVLPVMEVIRRATGAP